MPPKKGRQSPARFMPYLPPNTPRRDWELQNAEVRAIAANRTLPSSTIEHLEATSSTMKQHESVGFAGDMVTPDLGRDESSYAPEPDLSISLPLATAGERVLIDHYIRVLLPEVVPIYALFDVSSARDSFFVRLLQHDDFYHIGMALCYIKFGSPISSKTPETMQRVFEYIGLGMNNLRKRIQIHERSTDDITIMATAYLAELASLTTDNEAHQIHRTSLKEMLNSRGGVDNLGLEGAAKCTLQQMQLEWVFHVSSTKDEVAFLTSQTTKPPASRSSVHSSDLLEDIKKLPFGFRIVAAQQLLSSRTINIIIQANQLVHSTQQYTQPIEARTSPPPHSRTFSTFHDALLFVSNDPNLPPPHSPTLNSLTLLAIFLFTCRHNHRTTTSTTTHSQIPILLKDPFTQFRQHLTTSLTNLDITTFIATTISTNPEIERQEIRACLIWIFTVTIDAWMINTDKDEAIEVVDELMKGLGKLIQEGEKGGERGGEEEYAVAMKEELVSLLQRYLYSERLGVEISGLMERFGW